MRILFFIILYIFIFSNSFSQSRTELEKRRNNTLRDIQQTESILENIKQSKTQSIQRVNLLEKKISLRNQLIGNLSDEVNHFEVKIGESEKTINNLSSDIKKIKEEYARMIYLSYLNKSNNSKILFLLSSTDFNQAYKRLKYFNQYSDYRKQQVENIKQVQTTLRKELVILDSSKKSKSKLLVSQQLETSKLVSEQSEKNEYFKTLKSKEENLLQKLKEQQRIAKNLDNEINRIIREEIEKARLAAIAREKARQERERLAKIAADKAEAEKQRKIKLFSKKEKPTTPAKPASEVVVEKRKEIPTDNNSFDEVLSSGFRNNKGKLPWPVDKGIITRSFGEYHDPVYKHIIMQSNGIDISLGASSNVHAIFDGEVCQAISLSGWNYVVIIRHGNFYTLYANLTDITVRKDQKISAKQTIGRLSPTNNSQNSMLHIEVWQDLKKLDPELWLRRN